MTYLSRIQKPRRRARRKGKVRGVSYLEPRDVWGPHRRPEIQSTPECIILKKNSKIFFPEGVPRKCLGAPRECFPVLRCGSRRAYTPDGYNVT